MLAQNFKTATDLGITDAELDALIKVLGMLERGEIQPSEFDMGTYGASDRTECGTVGCLCGWAHVVARGVAFPEIADINGFNGVATRRLRARLSAPLLRTFNAQEYETDDEWDLVDRVRRTATPASAAIALRSYLTTGEANWAEALNQ